MASPALFRAPSRNASACMTDRAKHRTWRRSFIRVPKFLLNSTTHSSSSSSSSRRLILFTLEQRAMCGCVRGWFSPLQQGCSPPDDLPQHYNRGNAPRLYWRAFFPPCHPTIPSLFLSLYPHIDLSFSHHLEISPPPIFYPSLIRGLALSSLLPVCPPLSHMRSFSFRFALFFLRLCAICLSLIANCPSLISSCFVLFFLRTYVFFYQSLSILLSSLLCSFLAHKSKVPSRWWYTYSPLYMRTIYV